MNKENPQTTQDKPTEAVVVQEQPISVMKDGTQIMKQAATAQQMRVMEVNEALAPAYARASTLELTEAEINGLTLPFTEDKVEVRPHDGLIYIPHIHISNRLNAVFSPGKWSLICRRHWLEGSTMYGEYILLIKGCYVGESVGGHPYIASNPKTNYSDALESTAAEALRRICGKRLSCGSQVWDPTYANQWCMKYRFQANGKYYKKMDHDPQPKPEPVAVVKKPVPKEPTKEEQQAKARKFAERLEPVKEMATQYCVDLGWILPDREGLADVSYTHLPKTDGQFKLFREALERWAKDGVVRDPYSPVANTPVDPEPEPEPGDEEESDAKSEPWYDVIVPIPHKCQKRDDYLKNPDTIGSLYEARHDDEDARKRLWGFATNYEPKGWTGKDGKTRPPNASDIKFREALDRFVEWFEKSHPDEKL